MSGELVHLARIAALATDRAETEARAAVLQALIGAEIARALEAGATMTEAAQTARLSRQYAYELVARVRALVPSKTCADCLQPVDAAPLHGIVCPDHGARVLEVD